MPEQPPLPARAAAFADRTTVVGDDGRLTHAELDQRSRRVALHARPVPRLAPYTTT